MLGGLQMFDRLGGIPVVLSEAATADGWEYDDWGPFWTWGTDEPPSWAVYFGFARKVRKPAAMMLNGTLYVHPDYLDTLKAGIDELNRRERAAAKAVYEIPPVSPGGFLHKGFA